MKLDVLFAKEEHLFSINSPEFCGSPILGIDSLAVKDAANRFIEEAVRLGKNNPSPNTAEVLPGEEICPDNVIRRSTTAEVMGDTYYNREFEEKDATVVSIEVARLESGDGKMIMWRPDHKTGEGEYALVY